jgi:1-deoxy-D-xylulose-5-phosphate reductoisomerase
VLNAANEVAVEQFLAGGLPFDRIARLIEDVLSRVNGMPVERLEDVLAADRAARDAAHAIIPGVVDHAVSRHV